MDRFKGKYERELPVRKNVIGSFIPIWNIIVLTNLGWRYGTLAILTITLVSFALLGLFTLFGVVTLFGDNYDDMPLDDPNSGCISLDDMPLDDPNSGCISPDYHVSHVPTSFNYIGNTIVLIAYLGLQGLITWYFIKKHNTRVRVNNSNISPN